MEVVRELIKANADVNAHDEVVQHNMQYIELQQLSALDVSFEFGQYTGTPQCSTSLVMGYNKN